MNVQVIADPLGRLPWASPALPGAAHDIKAARTHGIIDALTEARVTVFADKGYRGAGGTVRIPTWGPGSAGAAEAGQHHPRQDPRGRRAGDGDAEGVAAAAEAAV